MLRWAPLHRAAEHLLDLVFPPHCALCNTSLGSESTAALCTSCRRELIGGQEWRCRRCAGSVSQYVAEQLHDCPYCRGTVFRFQAIHTLGSYGGRLRSAVLSTKHVAGDALMVALADLLFELRRPWFESQQIDLVVSVPMHWRRRATRGVNGADRLATQLAQRLGVKCKTSLLRRARATHLQGTLRPAERFRNVRGVFVTRKRALVCGKRVLLVDDILTTGATCNESAHTLQTAGASHVAVAVLARAQGRH